MRSGISLVVFISVTAIVAIRSVPAASAPISRTDAQKACGGHMEPTAGGARTCMTNKGATAYYCGGTGKSKDDCVKIDLPKKTSGGKTHPPPVATGTTMRSDTSKVGVTGTAINHGTDSHHSSKH
jgi:hypothetical protein